MEENDKGLELAYKIGELLNGYSVGDGIAALMAVLKSIVDSHVSSKFEKMKLVITLISDLSDKGMEIINHNEI